MNTADTPAGWTAAFVDLVDRMLATQKRYFRAKSVADLDAAKKLEATVREAIDAYRGRTPPALPFADPGGRHP